MILAGLDIKELLQYWYLVCAELLMCIHIIVF